MDDKTATTFMVAGVVIFKDGKYLLVQEKQPKAYKQWNLPGGKVDIGETLEEAAIREAKEEAGYDVKLGRKVLVLQESVETPVKHAYEAEIIGGELNFPTDEILDAKWFTYEEVKALELRNPAYILGAIDGSRLN